MNEAKVREVLDYCYKIARATRKNGIYIVDYDAALAGIEVKIEELTDDDLGEE